MGLRLLPAPSSTTIGERTKGAEPGMLPRHLGECSIQLLYTMHAVSLSLCPLYLPRSCTMSSIPVPSPAPRYCTPASCQAPRHAIPRSQPINSPSPCLHINLPTSTQLPHLLQVLDNRHVRIHIPVHTVHNARLLGAIQFAGRNLRGHALAEAHVR